MLLVVNPNAIRIIENNLSNALIEELTINPNAIHILKEYTHIIYYPYLGRNPAIYLDSNGNKIYKSNINNLPKLSVVLDTYKSDLPEY